MFRYFHLQNLPELFTNYFFTNKEIHNHNTNYTKRTLANKGIEVWNNLSEHYKEPRSYDSFKKIIKNYFSKLDR